MLGDFLDSELPLAERCSAVLDGEAVRLGPAFTPVGSPPGMAVRARSLSHVLPSRLIADRRTAAWVYGALVELPRTIDACARKHKRPSALLAFDAPIREVVITEAEIAQIAGVSVTMPLRTVFDLVREPDFDKETAALVGRLARVCSISFEECDRYLDSRSHLPRKTLTRARLVTAFERGSHAGGSNPR